MFTDTVCFEKQDETEEIGDGTNDGLGGKGIEDGIAAGYIAKIGSARSWIGRVLSLDALPGEAG